MTPDIDSLYLLPNYAMFCNNRSGNDGGLILCIKRDFNAKMIDKLNVMITQLEKLFVEFSIKGKSYNIRNYMGRP